MTTPPHPSPAATVRRFTRADASWAEGWFADELLDRTLGPYDEEWYTHVLSDTSGAQLVVEQHDGVVALVGVAWGEAHEPHVITDLAVNPSRRGEGLGRVAVGAVRSWPGHPPCAGWLAFVEPENDAAAAFFRALGWTDEGVDDGMRRFVSA
ncbi:GNAT family N-acetyltransferase [Microbacterium sp. TNHR37B]|uniref:GNAT family N-acetyltransferase n=1 Tax=Microbacterium sp. TNHR37B TaxID=1775956 RepID=UPI0008308F49|nr:GNAT family N-acetyltransferase [Microbacterium sp. TNHR37B]